MATETYNARRKPAYSADDLAQEFFAIQRAIPSALRTLGYDSLPSGSGSWDTGAGTTITITRALTVTGVTTFSSQPVLSTLTASQAVFTDGSKGLVSNAITGSGNVVMSASPTLTGTAAFAAITASSTIAADSDRAYRSTMNSKTWVWGADTNGDYLITQNGVGTPLTFAHTTLAATFAGTVTSNSDRAFRSTDTGNLWFWGANGTGWLLTENGVGNALAFATGMAATFGSSIATSAPTGGAGAWELGIANAVSPTSPNRTITIEIGGTAYYLHAKTTND